MSILSSNNAGIREAIKQWWIGVKSKKYTFVSSIRDGDGIDVVKDGDKYIVVDREVSGYVDFQITENDWNSRPRTLKCVYSSRPGLNLKPVEMCIISSNHDVSVDLTNISNEHSEHRWKINILCPETNNLEVYGLCSDEIDLHVTAAGQCRMHDISGDVNIKLETPANKIDLINNVTLKDNSLIVSIFSGNELFKNWRTIIKNRKKDTSIIIPQSTYISDLDDFFHRNQIKYMYVHVKDYSEHEGSFFTWAPLKVTYKISRHKRYKYYLELAQKLDC